MRVTIDPEQQKFFQLNGYISFEELLPRAEREILLTHFADVRRESPHYEQKDLFRSIKSLVPTLKKHNLGAIAAKLLDKKPIHLVSDQFFPDDVLPPYIPKHSIALLLSMNTGEGLFYQGELPESSKKNITHCFLLVFSTNYTSNPTIFA